MEWSKSSNYSIKLSIFVVRYYPQITTRYPLSQSRRIIGIDPGLTRTGIGVIDAKGQDIEPIDWLTIETAAALDAPDRLRELEDDLLKVLEEMQPDLAVVEKLFFATNKRTASSVSQARGVILATLASRGIPILEPTPLQLKSAIAGDGKADKHQMTDMVMRTLKLQERPTPADAADGLALALYGAFVR